jgi:hypothetical protein
MLLSGSVPPEALVARPSPGPPSQQQPPRAAAVLPMASPRAFSPPQSHQDAALEALHARVLRLISPLILSQLTATVSLSLFF